MRDYNDTNIGESHVYDTPEDREIERLTARLTAARADADRLSNEVEAAIQLALKWEKAYDELSESVTAQAHRLRNLSS